MNQQTKRADPNEERRLRLGSRLFDRFKAIFRDKFTARFADEDEVTEWLNVWAYAVCCLTSDQIQTGVERCLRECDWPPTAPGEFIKLCQVTPISLGLPEPIDAFWIALSGISDAQNGNFKNYSQASDRWRHPVIWHSAHDPRINRQWGKLRGANEHYILEVWSPVYFHYLQRLSNGEEFKISEQLALGRLPPAAKTTEEKARSIQIASEHIEKAKAGLRGDHGCRASSDP